MFPKGHSRPVVLNHPPTVLWLFNTVPHVGWPLTRIFATFLYNIGYGWPGQCLAGASKLSWLSEQNGPSQALVSHDFQDMVLVTILLVYSSPIAPSGSPVLEGWQDIILLSSAVVHDHFGKPLSLKIFTLWHITVANYSNKVTMK